MACVHAQGSEAPEQRPPLAADALAALLWPKQVEQRWAPASEAELRALEDLLLLLLRRAEVGELGKRDERRVQGWLAHLDLELRSVELRAGVEGERTIAAWLLRERGPARRGLGAYLIRRGELGPLPSRPRRGDELLLQAPHVFFDRHSGVLALDVFLGAEAGGHEARALFVNTVHRYRRSDGSKRKDADGDNPADAAHASDHPLARVSAKVLRRRPVQILQIHGFAREPADPEIIVSTGTTAPTRASVAVQRRLQAALPAAQIAHFGVDIDRLGATTNIQGQAARAARRCFVHLELADQLREQLLVDGEVRARFAAAVLEGTGEEGARGCR